ADHGQPAAIRAQGRAGDMFADLQQRRTNRLARGRVPHANFSGFIVGVSYRRPRNSSGDKCRSCKERPWSEWRTNQSYSSRTKNRKSRHTRSFGMRDEAPTIGTEGEEAEGS